MKIQRLFWSIVAGVGLAITMLIILGVPLSTNVNAAPTTQTLYVLDNGGSDTGNCTDSQNPCKTVGYALGKAFDGDTIQVANKFTPAVYTERITITKSVILEGGWNATTSGSGLIWQRPSPCEAFRTTLDANNTGRVISIGMFVHPTIDCLTITGGNNDLLGGGIYGEYANPIISNNIITGNFGTDTDAAHFAAGGGIYLTFAGDTTVISGNLIANNTSNDAGGGRGGGIDLFKSNVKIVSNTIQDNVSGVTGNGGGITVRGGKVTIAHNYIIHNVGSQQEQSFGGGVYALKLGATDAITIENNLIQNNIALIGIASPGTTSEGGGIYCSNFASATIRNNTIQGNSAAGKGSSGHPSGKGGGIYLTGMSNITLSGNNFVSNIAGFNLAGSGGGIYLHDSNVVVTDNHFSDNSATWTGSLGIGGGIFIDQGSTQVISNVIESNYGGGFPGFPGTSDGMGGGVAISDSLSTVQDNRIVGNGATNSLSGTLGVGSGLYGFLGILQITGNTISDNDTHAETFGVGGGVYLEQVTSTLDSNIIIDNQAFGSFSGRGGGIRINNCPAFTLTNNIIAHNKASELGSGVAVVMSPGKLVHNTIAENTQGDGSGIFLDNNSDVALINNILVSHTVGISVTTDSTATMNATMWGSGAWANGSDWSGAGTILTGTINVWGNPSFIDPLNKDYHIDKYSAALDAGIDAGVNHDIDGNLRPMGIGFDIGADEVYQDWLIFLPSVFRTYP